MQRERHIQMLCLNPSRRRGQINLAVASGRKADRNLVDKVLNPLESCLIYDVLGKYLKVRTV